MLLEIVIFKQKTLLSNILYLRMLITEQKPVWHISLGEVHSACRDVIVLCWHASLICSLQNLRCIVDLKEFQFFIARNKLHYILYTYIHIQSLIPHIWRYVEGLDVQCKRKLIFHVDWVLILNSLTYVF